MKDFKYYLETKRNQKLVKRKITKDIKFSSTRQISVVLKYINKNQNLENFDSIIQLMRKFFVFMKKVSGKYPAFDTIYIVENKNLDKLGVDGLNKDGNWIIVNNFKKIDYWAFFHEAIHIYNIQTHTGFIAEGLADFLSFLFLKESNFNIPADQLKKVKKLFVNKKKDAPLYDSLKKDYNINVDVGAKTVQSYAKSFLFWKMIHEKFGMDPIKEAFRMSVKKTRMNAVNVKNIIKKYTDEPHNYMKGWITAGEYHYFPNLKL